MKIFVCTLDGKKNQYDIKPDDKIKDLKLKLKEKTGIETDHLLIVYKGNILKDDILIHESVKEGEKLHMILRLK
jgi:hypothetical protein